MVPESPTDALGSHADTVRDLLVEAVRSRHDKSAEAHHFSGTRYGMGFGSQWRDLLDDTNEALGDRGYQSHKVLPAGYKLPIVNECLIYVWRVSSAVDAVATFASSPTRLNGFKAPQPEPMLFDLSTISGDEPTGGVGAELERVIRGVDEAMPLLLILVHSSPRQLRKIEWGIAELGEHGRVVLHGQDTIWQPELIDDDAVSDVEPFDSGTPIAPSVEPQRHERPQA
jgi:hypothetical protein